MTVYYHWGLIMGVDYNDIKRLAFSEVKGLVEAYAETVDGKLDQVKPPMVTESAIDRNAKQIDQYLIATQKINHNQEKAGNDNTSDNLQEIKQGRDLIDPSALIGGTDS